MSFCKTLHLWTKLKVVPKHLGIAICTQPAGLVPSSGYVSSTFHWRSYHPSFYSYQLKWCNLHAWKRPQLCTLGTNHMKTTPAVKAAPEGVPQRTYSTEMYQINLRTSAWSASSSALSHINCYKEGGIHAGMSIMLTAPANLQKRIKSKFSCFSSVAEWV